jgi:hypothetical protein
MASMAPASSLVAGKWICRPFHLDLYIMSETDPPQFRTDHLAAAVDARLETKRPFFVEGILLFDALASIGRRPDFFVYVEKIDHRSTFSKHVGPYVARQRPRERADYVSE